MLFVIGQSVAALFAVGGAVLADVNALDFLCLGAAEGSHRITGSRRDLMGLSQDAALNWKTRKALERAASRVSQEGNLSHQLRAYGVVEANQNNTPISGFIGTQRVISFPLRWFDVSAKVQPAILLGENLADANALQLIAQAGCALAGYPHLPLRLTPDHGGGSTIGQVLNSNAAADRLCVCVVDSDSAYPGGAIQGTAATVQPFKNPVVYPLVEVSETAGRDLENLLPCIFYQTAYGNHPQFGAMAGVMSQLLQAGEPELRAHVDVERGVTLRQIFNHPPGSGERVFWDAKLPVLMGHLNITPASLACLSAGVCAQPPGSVCGCVILAGNTANILTRFVSDYQSRPRYELANCVSASLRPEWVRLGANIASWCCGDDPLRV